MGEVDLARAHSATEASQTGVTRAPADAETFVEARSGRPDAALLAEGIQPLGLTVASDVPAEAEPSALVALDGDELGRRVSGTLR